MERERERRGAEGCAYGNAVVVLLSDALRLSLALLKGVLVLELGTHGGCVCRRVRFVVDVG